MSKTQKSGQKTKPVYKWGKRDKPKREKEKRHTKDFSKGDSSETAKAKPLRISKSDLQIRSENVKGFSLMLERKFNEGYDIYIFTFLFNPLGDGKRRVVARMRAEVERFYSRFATRIARKPTSDAGHRMLPFMVLYPDTQVFKSAKKSLLNNEIMTNEGLHMHGACAADRRGRIKDFLDVYFERNQAIFAIGKIRKIHVERVTHLPGYVTDYALKSAKRRWFEHDDFLVLPRTKSEVSQD